MELNSKNIKKILLIVFFSAIIVAAVFNFPTVLIFAKKVLSFFTPIILALCIAFVLNVFFTGFETKVFKFLKTSKHKFVRAIHRPVCLVLTYALALGVLSLIILVIIPDISDTITYLIEKLPTFIVESREWLIQTLTKFHIPTNDIPQIDVNSLMDTIRNLVTRYSNNIVNNVISITTSVANVISDIAFGVIVSIYVLAQKEKIGNFVKRVINSFIPPKAEKLIIHVSKQTYNSFTRFIGGQLAESIILGVLCYIGMLIFGFPNAAIISIIICITALVPIVGALVGAIIGAFLILVTSPIKAVLFIIFLIILQQIEGNLIYPKIVGKAVGLPGVIVISAVLVGGNIGGILGALIAVPLSAVIYILLKEAMDNIKLKRQVQKTANTTDIK